MSKVIDLLGKDKFNLIDLDRMHGSDSIVITAINSIFSIQAKYNSTVKPLIKRFIDYIELKDADNDSFTPKQFVEKFKNYSFDELASNVFKNRQRTSARGGILKAEASYLIIEMLNNNDIQSRSDIINYRNLENIEKQWKNVRGQASGITWRYFLMGVGFSNYFKDDTWIYRFFINELGYDNIRMNGDYQKLKLAFEKEFEKVKRVYPKMTISKLDNLIWEYMSNRK